MKHILLGTAGVFKKLTTEGGVTDVVGGAMTGSEARDSRKRGLVVTAASASVVKEGLVERGTFSSFSSGCPLNVTAEETWTFDVTKKLESCG